MLGNISDTRDPEMESNVDVIKAPRSPGSTLKPVLYAAMLSDGMILPNSIVPDIPTQIGGYAPQNFDLTYDGAVPASKSIVTIIKYSCSKIIAAIQIPAFL